MNKVLDLSTRAGRQAFYQTSLWRKLRDYKITMNPLCEECERTDKLVPATEVHHITDIDIDPTIENALNLDGLMSLCKSCHSTITNDKGLLNWEPFNMEEFLSKQKY
jgi:5-methylcytosine-specific restriction enzyme A